MSLIRILLIEDSPSDAQLLESMLAREKSFDCTLTCAERLAADGVAQMAHQTFDVVLTDLDLPDSRGLAAVEALHKSAPHLPIVVFTQRGDAETGLAAIQAGAQDILPKGELSGLLLARTIRHAIERKEREAEREKLLRDLQEARENTKALGAAPQKPRKGARKAK